MRVVHQLILRSTITTTRGGVGKRKAALTTPNTSNENLDNFHRWQLSPSIKLKLKKKNYKTPKVKKREKNCISIWKLFRFFTYCCQPASPVRTEVHRWHAFTHAHSHTYAGRWRITSQPKDVRKTRKEIRHDEITFRLWAHSSYIHIRTYNEWRTKNVKKKKKLNNCVHTNISRVN